jgi:FlaA1/EpsC-like NDP-sugar epimerase
MTVWTTKEKGELRMRMAEQEYLHNESQKTHQYESIRINQFHTMTNGTILVTGGCGYIGTHTITVLMEQGYDVVVVDNLSNSSPVSLDRVAEICKLSEEERAKRLIFHQVDVCDEPGLRKVFETYPPFTSCIHFAGLKVCR